MSKEQSPNLRLRTKLALIGFCLNFYCGSTLLYAQGMEQQVIPQIQYMPSNLTNTAWPVAVDENIQPFEFSIIDESGGKAGYVVGQGKSGIAALANGLPDNWGMKAVPMGEFYDAVKSMPSAAAWEYKGLDDSTSFWFPTSPDNDVPLFHAQVSGSTVKVNTNTALDRVMGQIYGKTQTATEATRKMIADVMVNEAKEIACIQEPRTTTFTTVASFGASVSFIAGAEGGINYQGTWNTSELCAGR